MKTLANILHVLQIILTILLAVAATSAIATPLAGRLYDKIGPRMNLIVGFIILCVNTWQLSKIEGNTSISYIIFLLALRGLAVGLTLQTSFVAALSSIPLDHLPRGKLAPVAAHRTASGAHPAFHAIINLLFR